MATKTKNLRIITPIVLTLFIFLPNSALATKDCKDGGAMDCLNQGGASQVMKLLEVGLNILSGVVFLGAVIMLIVAGIQYTASNGDPQAVQAAKKKITDVLIGLAAYIFLYAFIQWLIPGGNKIL